MKIVLYEDRPKWDLWVKALLAFAPIECIVLGIVLSFLIHYGVLPAESEEEAKEEARVVLIVFFALAAFLLLLFWAIFPRKYQILEDRIKIVLGGPFSFNIGFNTIKEARGVGPWSGTITMNFITSFKGIVEILRSKGISVAISPSNRELFLEELNKAMANWKRSQGIS